MHDFRTRQGDCTKFTLGSKIVSYQQEGGYVKESMFYPTTLDVIGLEY